MESLTYKHYLNSLLVNAAAGLHGTNNNNLATSTSQSSANNTQVNNFNTQQYLQQQQLLSTFGAYARHPAYASLIASALNNWPSIPTPSTASPAVTNSYHLLYLNFIGNRSENSNRRRDSSELTDSSSISSQAYSSFMPERNSNHNPSAQDNPFQMSTGNQRVDSMLAAVYQQAAAMNLAYMCNPLTAAALYSQIMLSCSGAPNTPDVGLPNINLASNATHQATLASLYANYLLSAKQMQQRQVSQSPGHWDTQQLLSSLAATLASACGGGGGGGTGEIDTAALLSMFGGATNISPTVGTTSTPLKHSSMQRRPYPQSYKRTHPITTTPPPTSDMTSSVGSERETQDSGDIRQTVSCRHSDQSQDNYDTTTTTKEYEESQTILDLSK
ncbi:unnamed protein product [Trichobilharzia regenti]|nr:unnamed protein product [Trichobilharzia regenti]